MELAPNEAMAHNNLGLSLVQTGRVEEALPQYAKALELSPDYAVAHNNLDRVKCFPIFFISRWAVINSL